MEEKSKEKLASVSNLVTVFENSRYGVVGVGRVTLAHGSLPPAPPPSSGPLGSTDPPSLQAEE